MKFFEEISEHGIFYGIIVWQENKPLNIKDKKGLFTIGSDRINGIFHGIYCVQQGRKHRYHEMNPESGMYQRA